jgi:uncharacterized protein YndB with AHSA1/START domain
MKPGIHAKSGLRSKGRDDLARAGSAALTRPRKKARSRPKAERHAAVRVTSSFSPSPDRVFDAWLDRKIAGKWLFATASRPMTRVAIDARVGGSFCFGERRDGEDIEHTGEYIEIVPPRRLVFTLSLENHPHVITRVIVEDRSAEDRVRAHPDPRRRATGLREPHRGPLDWHPVRAWRDAALRA